MNIRDNMNQEVIRIERPFKCCIMPGCHGCNPELLVEAPVGNCIGSIEGFKCGCQPSYVIYDKDYKQLFIIQCPDCPTVMCSCGDDIEFQVTDAQTGQEIGKITKHWSGIINEFFTDADNFSITCKLKLVFNTLIGNLLPILPFSVPLQMDVHKKALLIGALFLMVSRPFSLIGC